jgi:hypothetical protein
MFEPPQEKLLVHVKDHDRLERVSSLGPHLEPDPAQARLNDLR